MPTIASLLDAKGRAVHTVASTVRVVEAVALMNRSRIGSVVVTDGDRAVCGNFTERDVLSRVVAAGRDPDRIAVSEVITTELITISPDAPLEDAMALMPETHHRHLPVVHDGQICGLVSIGDNTKWMVDDRDARIGDLISYITHG